MGRALPRLLPLLALALALAIPSTASAACGSSSAYSTQVAGTSGLVGYWRLGEASGTSACDSSATGAGGTYQGGFTLGQAGAIGGDPDTAVTLNGTTGNVNVPSAAPLSPTGGLTMEAWVKPSSVSGNHVVLRKEGQYMLRLTGAGITARIWTSPTTPVDVTSPGVVNLGAWQHIAATWDGTTVRIYRNGAQVFSQVLSGLAAGGGSALVFGSGLFGTTPVAFFAGGLDEVALYSTALSSGQVSAHAAAGLPPQPPGPLTATGGQNKVDLSWGASPSGNVAGYRVYRSSGGGAFAKIGTDQAGTTYTDTAVTPGTAYTYHVTALNSVGESAPNADQTATPTAAPPPPAPQAPGTLTANPGNAKVDLSWGASPTAGITGYHVKRSTDGVTFTTIASPTGTTYGDATAANGTTYTYQVTAYNAGGDSPPSNDVTARPTAPLTPPSSLTATPGDAKISLSWPAGGGTDLAGYRVYRLNGATWVLQGSTNAATRTFDDTTVTNGTSYTYRVVTIDGASPVNESAPSPQASTTPVAKPGAPTGLVATGGAGQIALSWNASAGATSYNVYRSSSATTAPTLYKTGVAGTTFTDTGLPASTTYYYAVTGLNGSGESGKSPTAQATTSATSTAGVVALWHMDERSGSVMVDSVGNHNGALHSVTLAQPGFSSFAYGFNGSSSYVSVPSTSDLNPGSKNLTITAHIKTSVKPPSSVQDWDLVRKGLYSDGAEFKMEYYPSGQAGCAFLGNAGYTGEHPAGPVLSNNQWHTIQCLKTSTQMKTIVDGVTVYSQTIMIGSIANNVAISIGARPGSEFFKGSLDEVSIKVG